MIRQFFSAIAGLFGLHAAMNVTSNATPASVSLGRMFHTGMSGSYGSFNFSEIDAAHRRNHRHGVYNRRG
jgi:hypothetical protein